VQGAGPGHPQRRCYPDPADLKPNSRTPKRPRGTRPQATRVPRQPRVAATRAPKPPPTPARSAGRGG